MKKAPHKRIQDFLDNLRPANNQDNWLANKEGEYRAMGFDVMEAKEKAMSDWHTYMAPNLK
jgi:hypothetical protein